jgi:hypothetical protein
LALLLAFILLRRRGPYEFEVLHNDVHLDILDHTGKEVRYSKTLRLKATRNGVLYYTEDLSTDGTIDDFEVSPGIVQSVKQEEGTVLVRTTFGRRLRKGDLVTRFFQCVYRNSFCRDSEYWVQRQVYPSQQVRLTFHFPADRPYKSYRSILKIGTYETPSLVKPVEANIGGRPCLIWELDTPKLNENYKLEWDW